MRLQLIKLEQLILYSKYCHNSIANKKKSLQFYSHSENKLRPYKSQTEQKKTRFFKAEIILFFVQRIANY